jgi:hypothetical protein
VNRHDLRQGCNLDELINQSEPPRDLASAQGTRGHKKTRQDSDGCLRSTTKLCRGKEVLRVKNKQEWVYQGHNWPNRTNENE